MVVGAPARAELNQTSSETGEATGGGATAAGTERLQNRRTEEEASDTGQSRTEVMQGRQAPGGGGAARATGAIVGRRRSRGVEHRAEAEQRDDGTYR